MHYNDKTRKLTHPPPPPKPTEAFFVPCMCSYMVYHQCIHIGNGPVSPSFFLQQPFFLPVWPLHTLLLLSKPHQLPFCCSWQVPRPLLKVNLPILLIFLWFLLTQHFFDNFCWLSTFSRECPTFIEVLISACQAYFGWFWLHKGPSCCGRGAGGVHFLDVSLYSQWRCVQVNQESLKSDMPEQL